MGVDLGTTVSLAGIFDRGQVQLHSEGGISSAVYFPTHGDAVVGPEAERQGGLAPRSSVTSVKRLLGGDVGDAAVRRYGLLSGAAITMTTRGRLLLAVEGRQVSAEQVVTDILAELMRGIERRFAVTVRSVVASVPATASAEFVRAFTRAAQALRLRVVETLPEPVAAALGLGLHLEERQREVLVCDFGGGYFDVAAIRCGFGRLDVIATSGDPQLGGDDFTDALLAGVVAEVFGHGLFEVIRDGERYQMIGARLERLKRVLSSEAEVRLRARDAYTHNGVFKDVDFAIDRAWAEKRWTPLVERAISIATRTIDHLGWVADDVVLLGGCAQTPLVERLFRERFAELEIVAPRSGANAVVRGVALRSSQFIGARARRVTRVSLPPPPSPHVPDVAEPNMATTARIEPITL